MDFCTGKLNQTWMDTNEIVLYGFGYIGKRYIDELMKLFHIKYIVDNSSEEKEYREIPIVNQKYVNDNLKDEKIVVAARVGVYQEIKKLLEQNGLIECENFCLLEMFVSQWFLVNKKQIFVLELHTSITTRCTLNCENCNMFMPFYKTQYDMDFEMFKKEIDLLFSKVSYIMHYVLLGGEPLINRDLSKMLLYLKQEYAHQIGELSLITNGTIIPDKALTHAIKESGTVVSISDYSQNVNYGNKMEQLIEYAKNNELKYNVTAYTSWLDFGFPNCPIQLKDNQVREHMIHCFPIFKGYNDGKFYFCHIAWSAEKAGLFQIQDEEYICMNSIHTLEDKKKFVNYSLGGKLDWAFSLCKQCGGCGVDNQEFVEAATQKKKGNER